MSAATARARIAADIAEELVAAMPRATREQVEAIAYAAVVRGIAQGYVDGYTSRQSEVDGLVNHVAVAIAKAQAV